MKLEEWIRKDMTRFIKDHEPESNKNTPIRHEDYGLVAKADYERRIKRALEQGRFKEATIQFEELKKYFTKIPAEHQEERKRYYRILQICYKLIYDYVEDMHKTHRLLKKLDNRQDVFDQAVAPQDLNQESTNPELAPPSIEERMFRKPPSQPAAQQPTSPPQQETPPRQQQQETAKPQEEGFFTDHPAPQAPQINFQSPQQAPQQIIIQQAPPSTTPQPTEQKTTPTPTPQPPKPPQPEPTPKQPETKPPTNPREEQATKEEALNQRLARDMSNQQLPVDVTQHAPSWEPPRFDKLTKNNEPEDKPKEEEPTPKQPVLEQPTPRPTDQQILEAATKDLLTQATHALQQQEHEVAKTKLIEARFEAQRTKNNQLLRTVEALERQLAASQAVNYHPKHDRELFSSAYLQGVQAMRAGNYQKAAQLFAKRTQQAPGDTAARIRYKECMEALNGTTTR